PRHARSLSRVRYNALIMRRLFLILLNIATAASMLFAAGTVAMWIRNAWKGDTFGWHHPPSLISATFDHGELTLMSFRLPPSRREPPSGFYHEESPIGFYGWEPPLGFSYGRGAIPVPGGKADLRWLTLPYWAIFASSAILPFIAARKRWRSRQRRLRTIGARCPNCNYDLRATPDRCPECGAITKRQPAPS